MTEGRSGGRVTGDAPPAACLEPADYVDSGGLNVVAFARKACEGAADPVTKAVRLY